MSSLKYVWIAVSVIIVLLLIKCNQETLREEAIISRAGDWLIPEPVSRKGSKGEFAFSSGTPILFEGNNAEKIALQFATELAPVTGSKASVLPLDKNTAAQNAIVLAIDPVVANGKSEGYELTITPEVVRITGVDAAGLFYGTRSLKHLMPPEVFGSEPITNLSWKLPCLKILDYPRFAYRGMHFDVSRHFQDAAYIKRLLDFMADLKLNRFHWHLTDDQGWRIEIKGYEKLTSVAGWRKPGSLEKGSRYINEAGLNGGFYTQDEVHDIIRYATELQIEIIPEIDFPGHCSAVNTAYPEFTAGNSGVVSASDEAMKFMKDVLDEIVELFPCKYIHIGGDEVGHGAWSKDPASMEKMRALGITEVRGLQDYITEELYRHLIAKGKKVVAWNEVQSHNAPKDIIIAGWSYAGAPTSAAKAGYTTIATPIKSCYLNYNPVQDEPNVLAHEYYDVSYEKCYNYEPVSPELTAEQASNFIGGQSCLWTEYIPRQKDVEWLTFPRLLMLAEVFWSQKERVKNQDVFMERVGRYNLGFDIQGVHYRVDPPLVLNPIDNSGVNLKACFFKTEQEIALVTPPQNYRTLYSHNAELDVGEWQEYKTPIKFNDTDTISVVNIRDDGHSSVPKEIHAIRYDRIEKSTLEPGLWSAYIEGQWQSLPDLRFSKTKPNITPVTEVNLELAKRETHYAIHFIGFISIPKTGLYTFGLGSDDGSVLDIGSVRVVNNDGLHGFRVAKGSALFEKGLYKLQIGFFQGTGDANLKVNVEGPGIELQELPTAWLFRNAEYSQPNRIIIETTLPQHQNNSPQMAFDSNPNSMFWSKRAPTKDDHFTVTFEPSRFIESISVATGKVGSKNDILESGTLWGLNSEGEQLRLAEFIDGTATAEPNMELTGIVIKVNKEQEVWLAIHEIELKTR